MALLRTKEIRAMDADTRTKKFKELRDELMHERGVAAMGGAPPNPGKIRALRKNIARLYTIQTEEAILAAKAPVPEAAPEVEATKPRKAKPVKAKPAKAKAAKAKPKTKEPEDADEGTEEEEA